MKVQTTRVSTASVVGLLAAAVLIALGLWLSLVDSFFLMRGRPPTRVATMLGVAALATGSMVVVAGKKAISRGRFAAGCIMGAAFVTSALAASVEAWAIAVPAVIVLIGGWSSRDGRTATARHSGRREHSVLRPAA